MNIVKLLLGAKALGDDAKWKGSFDGKPVKVPRVRLDLEDGRVQVVVVFRDPDEHRVEGTYEVEGNRPDVVRLDGRTTENPEVDFDAGVRGLGAALRYEFRFTEAGTAHVLAVRTRVSLI